MTKGGITSKSRHVNVAGSGDVIIRGSKTGRDQRELT
jgi:hypothetical protein